ncbi:MAG: hypothetical protein ACC742_16370, partial [Thermoanaerobaculales bacterium]
REPDTLIMGDDSPWKGVRMAEQQAQRSRRKFSDEFKRDAVEIVRSFTRPQVIVRLRRLLKQREEELEILGIALAFFARWADRQWSVSGSKRRRSTVLT